MLHQQQLGRRLAQQQTWRRPRPFALGEMAGRRRQQQQQQQRRGHTAAAAGADASAAAGGAALRRTAWLAALGLGCSALGAAAAWATLTAQGLGFYSDAESLGRFSADEADEEARRVEATINAHPLVAELRRRPELRESRPHMKMPSQYRARSLTGSALMGPGKVPVPAVTWTEAGGRSLVSVGYLGANVCGHPGIVHGGLVATLLDEGLAWCCFGALPHGIGVTARLAIDYRAPTPADSFVVLRAHTTRVEGRKAWVSGRLELLAPPGETPTVLAEAEALYVSPKYAAMMPRIH